MPNGTTEIARRGIRVYGIMWMHKLGDTPEVIAEEYELPIAAVYEALAYATEHPDEMDEIQRVETALEREYLMALPEEIRRGINIR